MTGFRRQLLGLAACLAALSIAVPVMAAQQQQQQKPPATEQPKSRETREKAAGEQAKPAPPEASKKPEVSKAPAELGHLQYRAIGPARGGRVSRVAGVAGDPRTYYAATASGGVWKSTDGGFSWQSIFDEQPISSIGSIAVSPSDPNVIYVGSGEANIRGNVAAGNGIYKSVDGGKTWAHVWQQEGQIGTMIVHPRNPDVAFAAVLGHAFGPNPERGVYRTTDGGKTWEQVLKKDANTGASDVCFDPSNPNILFAGFWQARRYPWDLESGGPGSGLYASRNGGDTWRQLTGHGLPAGVWGKIGVAVAPSDGRRVYALIEATEGGLFRSDDGGENWLRANGDHALRQRAWYYSTITVDPTNPDIAWFPQVPMLKTVDAGKTIVYVKGIHHGDHHDLWIDPRDPKRMISANDGGVDVTIDGGETWYAPPLAISQPYHVWADTRVPYFVAGALQDLGTAEGPSNSLASPGIRLSDWYDVGGGEAGYVVSDPSDPTIVYAGEYGGYISRYDRRTRQARDVSIYPDNPSGHGAADMKYRFQWTAPIATSPHDPKVVYHGGNVLFRTTDGGETWAAISPDLTRNDKSKQQWAGGPITGDNTGVETYCTIFAIAESPKQAGLIWVGSDDGLVHVTRDGGKTWTNVTKNVGGIPEWGTVSIIEPSPFDAGGAYLVVDNHRLDDMRPYLWKTSDYGRTWKSLSAKLPQHIYLHSVREDPAQKGLLYLGTERGVMFSTDDGESWLPLQLNLPTVAVHDVVVKGNDLVLATHGRSFWILDDLTPVRQLAAVGASDVALLPVSSAIRWRYETASREKGAFSNPPRGASIFYYLKEKPKGEVKIDILDAQGRMVNTLTSVPKPWDRTEDGQTEEEWRKQAEKQALATAPGVERGVWNLTWAGAPKIVGAKLDAGDPSVGPMAVPGTYTVKLTVDGKTSTVPLTIEPDPRVKLSQTDLEQQLAFGLAIRDALTKLAGLVNQVRSIRQQLADRNQALHADPRAEALLKASRDVIGKCDALEEKLHNPHAEIVYDILAQKGGAKLYSRMAPLFEYLTHADGVPTEGMRGVFADQAKELEGYGVELEAIVTKDLAALNTLAAKLGIPYVIVTALPRA